MENCKKNLDSNRTMLTEIKDNVNILEVRDVYFLFKKYITRN